MSEQLNMFPPPPTPLPTEVLPTEVTGTLTLRAPDLPAKSTGKDRKTGKFIKGNSLARGNPLNKKMQQFRHAMLEAITKDDVRVLTRKLFTKAKNGDHQCAKILLEYVMPKAPTEIEASVRQMTEEEMAARLDSLLGLESEEGVGQ